jgi:hypothetical protein
MTIPLLRSRLCMPSSIVSCRSITAPHINTGPCPSQSLPGSGPTAAQSRACLTPNAGRAAGIHTPLMDDRNGSTTGALRPWLPVYAVRDGMQSDVGDISGAPFSRRLHGEAAVNMQPWGRGRCLCWTAAPSPAAAALRAAVAGCGSGHGPLMIPQPACCDASPQHTSACED